jgi:PAS domain S-box-containing protein
LHFRFSWRTLVAAIGVAVAYAVTARLGESLVFPSAHVSALWAPNAILMSALLVANRRSWWVYLALVAPAHIVAAAPLGHPPSQVVAQYLGNCCTALIGAAAFRAMTAGATQFTRMRTALVFILWCALLAPFISSVLLAAVFAVFRIGESFWLTIGARSLTNAFAIVALVPLVMQGAAWARQPDRTVPVVRAAEGGLLLASLGALALFAYFDPRLLTVDYWAVVYVLFVSLLWAAMRFGVIGVCITALTLGVLATCGQLHRADPFVSGSPVASAILLLLFLVATCVALFLLAVALEERRLLEQASSANEARFRAIFSRNIIPTVIWGSDGCITDANESFYTLTGYDRLDLLLGRIRARSLIGAPAEEDLPARREAEARLLFSSGATERPLIRKDGRSIPVLVGGCGFPESPEGTAYFFDLTSLRRAEAARARAERLHTAVMASFQDQILVIDQTGLVIEANAAWRRLAEHVGRPEYERAQVGDSYTEACEHAARHGDPVAAQLLECTLDVLRGVSMRRRLELSCEASEGLWWYEVSVEPLRRLEGGAVITRTDITAGKRAATQAQKQREQLALLGRAAVLGELSGAFAHELAQPLTSILGNAETALQICIRDGPQELEEILRDIIRDDIRAAEVIQRLRSMLTRGEIERKPVDLNQVVRDVLALAHSELVTRNVTVNLQLEPRPTLVLADSVQLQQVLLNLVVNGCEAMSGTALEERRLKITTWSVEDRRSVECAVNDRGTGISPDAFERIFTPFFTTKKRGLGLGLAICRSIIEAHGGRLWAENAPDCGATFHFTLGTGA